jgi:hypothetical protein
LRGQIGKKIFYYVGGNKFIDLCIWVGIIAGSKVDSAEAKIPSAHWGREILVAVLPALGPFVI